MKTNNGEEINVMCTNLGNIVKKLYNNLGNLIYDKNTPTRKVEIMDILNNESLTIKIPNNLSMFHAHNSKDTMLMTHNGAYIEIFEDVVDGNFPRLNYQEIRIYSPISKNYTVIYRKECLLDVDYNVVPDSEQVIINHSNYNCGEFFGIVTYKQIVYDLYFPSFFVREDIDKAVVNEYYQTNDVKGVLSNNTLKFNIPDSYRDASNIDFINTEGECPVKLQQRLYNWGGEQVIAIELITKNNFQTVWQKTLGATVEEDSLDINNDFITIDGPTDYVNSDISLPFRNYVKVVTKWEKVSDNSMINTLRNIQVGDILSTNTKFIFPDNLYEEYIESAYIAHGSYDGGPSLSLNFYQGNKEVSGSTKLCTIIEFINGLGENDIIYMYDTVDNVLILNKSTGYIDVPVDFRYYDNGAYKYIFVEGEIAYTITWAAG